MNAIAATKIKEFVVRSKGDGDFRRAGLRQCDARLAQFLRYPFRGSGPNSTMTPAGGARVLSLVLRRRTSEMIDKVLDTAPNHVGLPGCCVSGIRHQQQVDVLIGLDERI